MDNNRNNFAFIDSVNVNLAVKGMGWSLDWQRFRVYLREKYGVSRAFLFLGYLPTQQSLYTSLQEAGFILVFKPTLIYKDGTVKGNCDAELVLHAMIEKSNYDQAVIVTGDGDFHCLIGYLLQTGKLARLLVPNRQRYSALLKKSAGNRIDFMNELRGKLEYKKRTP